MEASMDREHFALCSSSATASHSWHSGVLAVDINTVEQQLLSHADSHHQLQLLPLVFTSCVDPRCPRNTPPASCTKCDEAFAWWRCGVRVIIIINAMGMGYLCSHAVAFDILPTSPYLGCWNSVFLCVFLVSIRRFFWLLYRVGF